MLVRAQTVHDALLVEEHVYAKYCGELVDALAGFSDWQPLKEALENRRSFVHWIRSERAAGISEIICQAGHGAQQKHQSNSATDFQTYLEKVINPMIRRGEINDGSTPGRFDDRKVRWSDTTFKTIITNDGTTLRLTIGPTCYPHCQNDIHRKPVEAVKLMLSGLHIHNDPYAYFARGMGVVVIPLTRSGHAFIGRRAHTSEYSNFLCFVSGWATFSPTIKEIDFYRDVERELQEEIHLQGPIQWGSFRCAGLSGHPITGEADLVFVTQTDLSDDYFDSGHWPEHACWYAIRSREDAQQLLDDGRLNGMEEESFLMFSSRLGLEFLISNHWSS